MKRRRGLKRREVGGVEKEERGEIEEGGFEKEGGREGGGLKKGEEGLKKERRGV